MNDISFIDDVKYISEKNLLVNTETSGQIRV